MGHQLARAAAAGALVGLVVVACGGGDPDAELPGVLDNARDQVAVRSSSPDVGGVVSSDAAVGSVAVAELPPPDPSTFDGSQRIVNLWVDRDGAVRDIDVWARRTFASGPVRLADNIEFGELSGYFGVPPGHDLAVVAAGAGPDGVALGDVFATMGDEQLTTVFTNDDRRGGSLTISMWERGAEQAPAPPVEGDGLVVLTAVNTRPFGDELLSEFGSDTFSVGDGSTGCAVQRPEGDGFEPTLLGGSQRVELERPPGPATITLHPWFATGVCGQASAHEIAVDVVADTVTFVFVSTRTGGELNSIVAPVR